MSFADLEAVRSEAGLGVNRFVRLVGLPKTTYYRRREAARRPAHPSSASPRKRVQAAVMDKIKELCDLHPRLGHRPIHSMLVGTDSTASASSVLRVMQREKLLQPKRKGKLRPSAPLPPIPAHVGLTVGLDFTHWLGFPVLNVLEYESRYCLASVVFDRESAENATEGLRRALSEAERLGLATSGVVVKSDHGSVFTAGDFRGFLTEQGCGQALSAVGKPQGMGRVERFNRSVKEQRLVFEELSGKDELQGALDGYRRYYNEHRPHAALGYATPLSIVQLKSPQVVPSN